MDFLGQKSRSWAGCLGMLHLRVALVDFMVKCTWKVWKLCYEHV